MLLVVFAAAFIFGGAGVARDFTGFEEAGVFNGMFGPGDGFQAHARDGLAGAQADAEGAFIDADHGFLNFPQEIAFRFHQTEGEFLLEIIRAGIGHVDGHGGMAVAVLERFRTHMGADIAQ